MGFFRGKRGSGYMFGEILNVSKKKRAMSDLLLRNLEFIEGLLGRGDLLERKGGRQWPKRSCSSREA